jgi:hypothetical protein
MRKYRPEEDLTLGPSSTAANPSSQFLQLMNDYEDEQAEEDASFTEETIDEEYNSYVSSVPKRAGALDTLKFWEVSFYNCHNHCYIADIYKKICKTNRDTFPTLYKIALDYLPIQASSVPCERAFSSSGETDTTKRNRIDYDLFELLQILKYGFKKERLNFTRGLLVDPDDLTGISPELVGKDLLAERMKKGKGREVVDQGGFNWDIE